MRMAPALLGVLAVLGATRLGVGTAPDSANYVAAARNVLAGRGLSVFMDSVSVAPLTHYPPLYPILLAAPGALGVDPLVSARWLGALLFGLTILGSGLAVETLGPSSRSRGAVASVLVLLSVSLIEIHSMALTEPLFLLLALAGLSLLEWHLRGTPRGWYALPLSGVLLGLAFVTRYAGAALIASGVMSLALCGAGPRTRRCREMAAFLAAGLAPMAAWLVRNVMVSDHLTTRRLTFHAVTGENLHTALSAATQWLAPGRVPLAARTVLLGAALVGAAALMATRRRNGHGAAARYPRTFVHFLIAYALFLVVSLCFFDAATSLDHRILAPLYLFGLLSLVSVCPPLPRPAVVALALLVLSFAARSAVWVRASFLEGRGYASLAWRESETMARVSALGPGTPLVSNGADAIYLLTGRPAAVLAPALDPYTGRPAAGYASALRAQAARPGTVLVYFRSIRRHYLPSEEDLRREVSITLLAECPDGALYVMER